MNRNVLKKPGSLRIAFAICAAAPLLFASSAFAQNPSPAPAVPNPEMIPPGPPTAEATAERVIVTGSNIPTAEEVGPNPVDTYRQEDIQKLGVRSSTDLVQRLPAATGSALTENNTNGGDGRAEINLRGILAKETLVLIDGRRVAPVGFAGSTVDLNTIPFPLIDHIDILKDGASAIYGADAVAGVFNVFFKHKFRGLEVGASYGNANLGASNDQGEELGYLLAGTGDDKTDIVVYAELYNRAAIYSRDRDISSNGDFTRFGGLDARSGNFAGRVGSFVLNPALVAPTNAPGTHPFTPDAAGFAAAGYVPRSSLAGTTQNGLFLFNFAALTPAIAAVDREYFYGSVIRDICDKWLQFFADFKYARTFWDSGLAPTPFAGPPDSFNTDPGFATGAPISATGVSVPTQNAFNPFSSGMVTVNGQPFITGVRYRSLEAGLRTDKITTNNYMFTGGLRGTFSDLLTNDILKTWGYELGFRYNLDDRNEAFGGIVNDNALRNALLSTDPNTAIDLFGRNLNGTGIAGRTNSAVVNQVFVTTNHRGFTSLTLEDAKLYGDIWNLPAGPLSFAIGGEHRKETANDQPDPLTASGQTIGATNFQPTKGSRDVWAMWGELRIPVTSPAWNFIGAYSLEFDLAERYEFFSDFGDTEKPKFSVRYQPFDSSLTLRATYNEAFHAPTLSELFTSTAQSFPLVPDPAKLTPDVQINETIGGNPNLKPENAYEWTYGAVWTPKWVKGLTLSADWYHIDLRDVTGLLDPAFIVDTNFRTATAFSPIGAPLNGQFSNLIQRDPVTGQILNVIGTETNLSRIITEGLDYEAIYQLDSSMFGHGDFGTFTFTINGTYLARYREQFSPGQGRVDLTGQFLGATSGGGLPQNRVYGSIFYDLGGLDMGATVHYIGQQSDLPGTQTNGGDRKIREYTTLDLIVNYTFNFPQPVAEQQVAGYAKDGGKNVKMKDGKDKNVAPVSTAAYSECGWRAWLNNTTLTLGMNNVFDQDPPFVAGSFENGYDESTASLQGRFWYVGVKKRF
jgi:iron complex outermembrane receptor protein